MSADAVLRAAGWAPGRRYADAAEAVNALSQAGYRTWPELNQFLEEYGGLRIPLHRKSGRSDNAWVDPVKAMDWAFREWVAEYESRAGVSLVPIGYALHDHMMLLAGSDGRFFAGYDDTFLEVGKSVPEMVSWLLIQ